jgi:hypothetical protein
MEFFEAIESKEQVLKMINEIIDDHKNDKDILEGEYENETVYDSAIWILQELAEFKKIEFKGYFRTKFEKHSEFQRILGRTNFDEQQNKRELYVFMSAQEDSEIFNILKFVYELTHKSIFDDLQLFEMIYKINSKGFIFERY